MAVSKTLLAFSAICLLLAYDLYSPVPSGIDEPWLQRTYIAGHRLARWMAFALEMVTGKPALEFLRWQAESMYIPAPGHRQGLDVKDMVFDGVSVRVYTPLDIPDGPGPCIVYFRGGGWSIFTIDSYETVLEDLSLGSGMVLVSVSYRKSPEHPFPVPFDDCLKATRYILQNPKSVGVDASRVAVAGDGSGGNLAAAVSLRLSEENPEFIPHVKVQVLLQPALQATDFDTPSYRQNAHYTLLTRDMMMSAWFSYLGLKAETDLYRLVVDGKHVSPSMKLLHSLYLQESKLPSYTKNNYVQKTVWTPREEYNITLAAKLDGLVSYPFLAPLMAEDLSKAPKSLIVVGEFDVLRDDGLFYASRLEEAKVSVSVEYVHNQGHGFLAPRLINSWLSFSQSMEVWEKTYLYLKDHL